MQFIEKTLFFFFPQLCQFIWKRVVKLILLLLNEVSIEKYAASPQFSFNLIFSFAVPASFSFF